jgi:hypothetical protein
MGTLTPASPVSTEIIRSDSACRPLTVPSTLVESLRRGRCVLFLSAGANAAPGPHKSSPYTYDNAPPAGSSLAKTLAGRCGYPYEDITSLQRVSLYFQYKEGENRDTLIQAMREEISPDDRDPSPALRILAALPFTTIITTNYDNFFDIALRTAFTRDKRIKDPVIRVYDPTPEGRPEGIPDPDDPPERRPLLLKLHGEFDRPKSVVVTEEDYLNFIQKMSSDHYHPIHRDIRARLQRWPVLFLGYSLRDMNLRLLFRALRWNVDEADWKLHFSVDPFPDDLIVLVNQRESKTTAAVTFIPEDLWEFVPALYERVMGGPYRL